MVDISANLTPRCFALSLVRSGGADVALAVSLDGLGGSGGLSGAYRPPFDALPPNRKAAIDATRDPAAVLAAAEAAVDAHRRTH